MKTNEPISISDPKVAVEPAHENKAAEFYTLFAEGSSRDFSETDYLTFCPFEKKIPGFSLSRLFIQPNDADGQLIRAKQLEMRQVLFCKEDFNKIQKVFDFGCGHGTDLIQMATLYPHLQAHGFTITKAQAELGEQRIRQMGLHDRVNVFLKDSSTDPFPDRYDLIIGIEVSLHIQNKHSLFQNIASALNEDGRVVLMDIIGNMDEEFVDPNAEISISTQQDWVKILAKNQLVIDEIIDVSPQIANFLYDPEVEENIKDLPQVAQDSIRIYASSSSDFENGCISYCLIKLKKATGLNETERNNWNALKMAQKTPYPQALNEMEQRGLIPYPKGKGE